MKRNAVIMKTDGTLDTRVEDIPEVVPGSVLVHVKRSVFSPGTELGGWQNLAQSYKGDGEQAKEHTFGYSNAGIVEKTGEGVTRFQKGDRVVAIGAGYAIHADYAVVPHNLVFKLPEDVSFDNGAYVMLMATAMHAMRRGEPLFGENVCIVGLGLVGLLTGALYGLAGNFVVGWDLLSFRLDMAKKVGFDASFNGTSDNLVNQTKTFTRNRGLDAAVIAMESDCDPTMDKLVGCMKMSPDGHAMGRIMVVGWPTFSFSRNPLGGMNNIDIRRCSRTGFGYHDDNWEYGADYPEVVMPWTTRTNSELCLRLIGEKRIDVEMLTTHHLRLSSFADDVRSMIDQSESVLGVVIDCDK